MRTARKSKDEVDEKQWIRNAKAIAQREIEEAEKVIRAHPELISDVLNDRNLHKKAKKSWEACDIVEEYLSKNPGKKIHWDDKVPLKVRKALVKLNFKKGQVISGYTQEETDKLLEPTVKSGIKK